MNKYLEISKEFGFLSPKEIAEQISHAQTLFEMLPVYQGELLDIGAGGGLPSFVFMAMNQEFNFTLLDAMRKRTDFLEMVSSEISHKGVGKFNVVNGRAEEIARNEKYIAKFDVVIARGFGPPATTAECACNFLKNKAYLFVSGSPENEIGRWDKRSLELLGLSLIEVKEGELATGVILQKTGLADSKYPRRDGVPRKKPIW